MTRVDYQLTVGELLVSEDPCVVATVLGSCVSVALFSANGVGGLIHYALPEAPPHVGEDEVFRYGNHALPALIAEVAARAGVEPTDLRAKLVGGASPPDDDATARAAGPANVKFAREYLSRRGIKVVGEATGGARGRRIMFHTATGRLQVADLGGPAAVPVAAPKPAGPRRVLIVDDSKTIRDLLTRILGEDSELLVVGQAADAAEAERLLPTARPDVITLDIHMPGLTGVQWLERLLPRQPIPVVMISSLQMQEGNEVFRSLELGAVDYIQKPSLSELPVVGPLIREKVRAAASARVLAHGRSPSRGATLVAAGSFDPRAVLCIGASTGGTEALKAVLCDMPPSIPPTLIVQHIPPVFSKAFADRLNQLCPFEVKEAEDGDDVRANRVLIAPGGKQMAVEKTGAGVRVRITDDEPVNRHKPSVDYLFNSVVKVIGHKSVAVILTGMGADGARGLLALKNAGWRTLAQDEASCVVYGMPKAAFEMGAVDRVAPLDTIAREIMTALSSRKTA